MTAASPPLPGTGLRPSGRPAVAVLLLAPVLGEVLSTSTPPLDLLLPWTLALQAALYGSGALLCRELARRRRLGPAGFLLLAAAYGVYEEALVTGYWFDAGYQDAVGIGAYGRVWHTNLLVAVHLTAFHAAVSIGSSVFLVEHLFPAHRDRPWVGRRGLAAAAAALLLVVPLTYGAALRGPTGPLLASIAVLLLLMGTAVTLPRRPPGPDRPASPVGRGCASSSGAGRRRGGAASPAGGRFVGVLALAGTGTHFVLVYALPSTGVPWPVGILLAVAPILLAAAVLRRRAAGADPYGPVVRRVVTGILSFFLLLDALVGLGGRYDLTVAAVLGALALRRLGRRDRSPP